MKLKKKLNFKSNNQIWRILISDKNNLASEKLLIEERDLNKKEVYYSCIDLSSNKMIFNQWQPEILIEPNINLDDIIQSGLMNKTNDFDFRPTKEKFWYGVEAIYGDIIFFHSFLKPDLPIHKGLFAFDLFSQKIIWQSNDFNYLFIHKDELYTYQQSFDGRIYFKLNPFTGELIEEFGNNDILIKELKDDFDAENYHSYLFPEQNFLLLNFEYSDFITKFKSEQDVKEKPEIIKFEDALFISFHTLNKNGFYNNNFQVLDINTKKIIFKDVLNKNIEKLQFDSFFIKNNILYLLKEKNELDLYLIQ
ncbi:MAG: hypothetical protein STSR0008_17500 [Ignavibacterium sp.]